MAEKSDARIVSRTERNKASNWRDNAEGPPDEAEAHNGRPVDIAPPNSTLASRAKANTKQVSSAEDKAVSKASTKKS